jgi:hypothetical protein
MNAFWITLIIIGSIILLGVIFLIFALLAISMGLRNKFGPEFIPVELRINFNYFNVGNENKKTIKYSLNDNETDEIFFQISHLIANNIQDISNSFLSEFPLSRWIKIDDETYEYRQIESTKLKAKFSTKDKELIYYK